MRYGILSIIIAITGILFVIWFNVEVAEFFKSEFLNLENTLQLNPTVFSAGNLNKLIALGLVAYNSDT